MVQADSEVSVVEITAVMDRLGLEGEERTTVAQFFGFCGMGGMPEQGMRALMYQVADVQAGQLSVLDFEVRLSEHFGLNFENHMRELEKVAVALISGHPGD